MQGKQAKIVSPTQKRAMLGYLDTTRSPSRDRVMFLLSMKACRLPCTSPTMGIHVKRDTS
jgi:hypothetical protein